MTHEQVADRREQAAGGAGRLRDTAARPWARELAVLAGFLAAGVAVTWPLATYISGKLPATRDVAVYVWDLWWVAHQVVHLHNPWSTTYMAAPVGLQLAYHTLVPLLGVVMLPVTLAFGPSGAYNLLLIVLPGLAGYAMYRAARLWLPTRAGAIAAGAFFGLSGMVTYQDWYHINISYGTAFLPVTLEAAVRLRRKPTLGQAVILGAVLAGCLLVNQESAVMALILAALVLIGWLARPGTLAVAWTRLRAVAAAGLAFVAFGSPQLIAMYHQTAAGGTATMPTWLGYTSWVANVQDLFAPSPRLADDPGLAGLGHLYFWQTTFGEPQHVRSGAERARGGRPDRQLAAAQCLAARAALAGRHRARARSGAEGRPAHVCAAGPELGRPAGLGPDAVHLAHPGTRAVHLPRGGPDGPARAGRRGAARRGGGGWMTRGSPDAVTGPARAWPAIAVVAVLAGSRRGGGLAGKPERRSHHAHDAGRAGPADRR